MLSERRWLKIHDFLTFRPSAVLENKRFLFECKDSKSETGHSLLVRVDATHAGIVTGNRKFYRPDCMQDAVQTWIPKGVAPLPVLRGHDKEGDVLGRIREAKYIDDSWKYARDFPVLKDSVFYNRDSKTGGKFNVFKTVDWIQDNLARVKGYQGIGHIELGLTLTNPEAIQKILRDEYLCVSAGAITDSATCSICHTDWASEDKCEHRPGEIVDGRMAFLISGRFKYKELSFVNFGADPFAQVKSYELKDSLEKMFFLGLPLDDQQFAIDRGLKLTDSLYESDIVIEYEEPKMTIDVAVAQQTLKSPDLTAAQAFDLQDQLTAWAPESDEEKTSRRSLQSTLTAKIRKNGWKREASKGDSVAIDDASMNADLAAVPAVADGVNDAAAITTAVAEATECVDGVCDWSGFTLTDEDQAFFADEQTVYDELCTEMNAAGTGGELKDEQIKDAKLDAEARKKLGGKSFCGPNRTFPVEDCAHHTAALRLLGRAKISDGAKEKIRACVERKGKTLKCSVASKTEDKINTTATEGTEISDELKALAVHVKLIDSVDGYDAVSAEEALKDEKRALIKEILGHYHALDVHHKGCEPDLQYKIEDLHNALAERWGKDRWVAWAKKSLAEHIKDSLFVSKDELAEKDEAVLGLTDELAAIRTSVATKDRVLAAVLMDSKTSLATTLVMHNCLRKKDGYIGLNPTQIQDKIAEFAKRHIQSLKDAVTDLFAELQWSTAAEPGKAGTDQGTTVNDNAHVDEVDGTDRDPALIPALTVQDTQKLQRMLTYIHDATDRERYIADVRYGRVQLS
jgi:hypothetical protein